jgi:hypothetical protein
VKKFRLAFEDVTKCKDVAEVNSFIREYLDERELEGEERRRMYWALFYKLKEVSEVLGRDS